MNAPDTALFDVTIEPEHHLMTIVVRGFWDTTVLPAYLVELQQRVAEMAPTGGCRRILVDMSDYPIQSQAVAQSHARIIEHGKTEMRAQTAVVMTSTLSKLQAKRLANLAGREIFDDERNARVWLLAQPLT